MAKVKIGSTGRIIKGDDVGHFIKVVEDIQNTGGYLILISPNNKFDRCFDDWVENESALEEYFFESGWEIEWI